MPSEGGPHAQEARSDRGRGASARAEVASHSRGTPAPEPGAAASSALRERMARRSRAARSRGRPRRRYDSGSRSASTPEVRDREETPPPLDRILLSPEAAIEILDAFLFYETRRPALGARFLDGLTATLGGMSSHPESSPVARGNVRRARVPRFPYGFLYRIEGPTIRILALMRDRRRPREWHSPQ